MRDVEWLDRIRNLNYPTPYFVFDRARLRHNLARFNTLLPTARVHYAVKSNPMVDVVTTLHQAGCRFEIASTGELELLQAIGVDPTEVLYSSPVKLGPSIQAAARAGMDRFAFDSAQELERIAVAAPRARVYLRLSVTENGSRFSLSQKFGVDVERTVELMRLARRLGLRPYGLTFHIGSQATEARTWTYAIRTAGRAIERLRAAGIRIKMLDLGGGFPVEYTEPVPTLEQIADNIHRAVERYVPYPVELVVEPGRALVSTAAALVVSVYARLRRGRDEWLFVDAGAYNALCESLESQASMVFPVHAARPSAGPTRRYTITGPTCDSLDTPFKNVRLPADLAEGDRLIVLSTGAYSIALAAPFNGFSIPEVRWLDGTEAARARQVRRARSLRVAM